LKKKFILTTLLVIIFEQLSLVAQESNIPFEHFGVEQGVSSPNISDIYQDRTGYIWIYTQQGLDRYDGYKFTPYNYPKKSKVLSLLPGSIKEDKRGNIWIASVNGGIEKFNPQTETFKNYLPDPQHSRTGWGNFVIEIYIDKNDVMWIGSGYGFYRFNESNETFTSFLHDENNQYSLGQNNVNGIFEDKSGTLWLATGGGLDRFDRETNKFYHYWHYPNNVWGDPKTRMYWLESIIEDNEGTLWIGTDGGLLKFEKNTEKFTLYNHNSYNSPGQRGITIMSLLDDGSGNIWLGTFEGLDIFNKKSNVLTNYNHDENDPESLSSFDVSSILIDRTGSIWIGTFSEGINKLDYPNPCFKKYINNPFKMKSFDLGQVVDLYEDNNGTIWVSTNKGVKIFDAKNEMIISKYNFICGGCYHDKSDNIIIETGNGGLYKFDGNNWTCYIDSTTASFSEFFRSFYQRHYDYFWIGSYNGNLYSFYPLKKKLKRVANIFGENISTIYEDSYNLVWFGGFSTGLFCYDPEKNSVNEYVSVPEDSSTIIDNNFLSAYEDKKGTLWFGCGNGLVKFNRLKNNFTRFYGHNGFLDGGVNKILEDDHGYLWMSTGNGITKFNPVTGEFKDYYSANYFPEIKFSIKVGCKSKNGEMYFGGENGFVKFHPDSIKEDNFIPPIVITSFRKFEKSFPFGKEIELPHSDNFISFEFAALSYINSAENQYAYKMEGVDKDWVYCGKRRFASYPNMDPGEYVFRVKGSTSNRVWNEAGTSIKIIILPPWWRTWWAYSTYAFLFVFSLYGIRRYEMNRLRLKDKVKMDEAVLKEKEEADKIKSNFFANISHEFRTPLTLILGPAEKIEKKQSTNPSKDAGIITRNSRRLLQLVNQLLDLSKLDEGKLKLEASPGNIISFVKGIALSFESLSESRDITIKIKSDKEFTEVYFDKEKMVKVFSNLLSNAFKFTPLRGNVIINVAETLNNTVEIKIRNTGVGIPKKELPKLFDRFYQVDSSQTKEHEGTGIGLALVKELVELHHGKIEVDSEMGSLGKTGTGWTEFVINLPLGRDHLKEKEIIKADETLDQIEAPVEDEYLTSRELTDIETTKEEGRTTILVVEDNYDMREYIKESLCDIYRVEEAVNGEQGVRVAEDIIPDLIISDLMMPKMDGNELTRILKNDEKTSHIPIILLTAKSGQENKIEGLQTGADDYLTKPFDVQELRVRVENLISIRKKLQEKFSKGEFLFKRSDKKIKSIDEKFLAKVLEVIEKHLSEEEFSIEECSNEVGLSRTHLHKKLKALVGKSPSQYLRTVRLHRAKQMIEEEIGNVSEVAYSVGFSSPAYFSKCFKEEFGYSPSDILT
jgi:signal transduction histidine kinase/ligand-binding sensor domain-containing protein/DNA-binding response OmpR family regulator